MFFELGLMKRSMKVRNPWKLMVLSLSTTLAGVCVNDVLQFMWYKEENGPLRVSRSRVHFFNRQDDRQINILLSVSASASPWLIVICSHLSFRSTSKVTALLNCTHVNWVETSTAVSLNKKKWVQKSWHLWILMSVHPSICVATVSMFDRKI